MSDAFWRREPEVDPASVGVDAAVLDRIEASFREGVGEGVHTRGAQLALCRDGRRVFDMGGGTARVSTGEPVVPETMFVMFSSTKGLAALAMLMLYERKAFHYDEPVVKYWPEFSRAVPEKSAISIRHVLSHRAAMPSGPRWLGPDYWNDRATIRRAMEELPLKWTPGEKNAYHAVNFGHLVNELIERIDGRDCGRFLREEVFDPLGLEDIHLGLPDDPALEARVAWCYNDLDTAVPRATGLASGAAPSSEPSTKEQPQDIEAQEREHNFNRPDVHRAVLPAAGGIGTARDLAAVFAALALGGAIGDVRLVTKDGLAAATAPTNRAGEVDARLGFPIRWTTGFHVGQFGKGSTLRTFGHGGAGGQMTFADPDRRLSFAFLCNGEMDAEFLTWRYRIQSQALEACSA